MYFLTCSKQFLYKNNFSRVKQISFLQNTYNYILFKNIFWFVVTIIPCLILFVVKLIISHIVMFSIYFLYITQYFDSKGNILSHTPPSPSRKGKNKQQKVTVYKNFIIKFPLMHRCIIKILITQVYKFYLSYFF